eukprot:5416498-Pleurochrysis_carterae.AAC.1
MASDQKKKESKSDPVPVPELEGNKVVKSPSPRSSCGSTKEPVNKIEREQKQNIRVIPPRLEEGEIVLNGKVFGRQSEKGWGPIPRDDIQSIDANAVFRAMFIGNTRVCIAQNRPSGLVIKPGVEVKGIEPARAMFNSDTSHPRIKYARSAERWGIINLCRAIIDNGPIPDAGFFMFKWRDAVKPEIICTTNTRKPRSRVTPADKTRLLSEIYKVEMMSKGGGRQA